MKTTTAPLLRIRPDGVPEMLVAGTLADGARYEASAEAASEVRASNVAIRIRVTLPSRTEGPDRLHANPKGHWSRLYKS